MTKPKSITAKTSKDLAKALGLDPTEAIQWSIRATLNDKIISVVKERRMTHVELSAVVGTSRPRITALLNRRRSDISTDLMLRVLAHLGVVPRLTFRKSRAG